MSAIMLKEKSKFNFKFFDKFNNCISTIIKNYRNLLNIALNNRRKVFSIFAVLLLATYGLFKIVPQSFIPIEDQAYFSVIVQAPEGSSLEETQRIVDKIDKIFEEEEGIKGYLDTTGYSFNGNSSNKALIYVDLKPNHERKSKKQSAKAIVDRINKKLSQLPDATAVAFEPPAIEGIGTVGGFQFEIKDNANNSLDTISSVTQEVISESLSKANYVFKKGDIIFITMNGVKEIIPGPNGYYKESELLWLDKILTRYSNKKVVILQHFPLLDTHVKTHSLYKKDRYLEILRKHNNVIAIISGHYHQNREVFCNNTYHIVTPNFSNNRYYKLIEIDNGFVYTHLIDNKEKGYD